MTRIIDSLAEIAADYDALFCDLWGCYHNGVTPYAAAVTALRGFRARGGAVVLMTNAPRANRFVLRHLDRMGAPADSWDAVVSSGDAALAELASGRWGRRVEYVGPPNDLSFFEGLDVALTGPDEAEAVVCIGLEDDSRETPDDYAGRIAGWAARGLPMLCANPDIVVDRGHERLWCAGAIAEAYRAAGGTVAYPGKPHPPIYALGRELLAGMGRTAPRILAVGDGIATDVLGGAQAGVDTLFVTGGLAAEAVSDDPDRPDPARLARWLESAPAQPTYAIGRLR